MVGDPLGGAGAQLAVDGGDAFGHGRGQPGRGQALARRLVVHTDVGDVAARGLARGSGEHAVGGDRSAPASRLDMKKQLRRITAGMPLARRASFGAPVAVPRRRPRARGGADGRQAHDAPHAGLDGGLVRRGLQGHATRVVAVGEHEDVGAGLQALRDYAATPVSFTPLKSEPLLRLLIADLAGEEVTRTSMATLRDDVAELLGRLDEMEAGAAKLAHREKELRLIAGFVRRLLELHLDLVDEVERELGAQPAEPGLTSPES